MPFKSDAKKKTFDGQILGILIDFQADGKGVLDYGLNLM